MKGCGGKTCMGHGDNAICGEKYYNDVSYSFTFLIDKYRHL